MGQLDRKGAVVAEARLMVGMAIAKAFVERLTARVRRQR
jgi:hypothetical protein